MTTSALPTWSAHTDPAAELRREPARPQRHLHLVPSAAPSSRGVPPAARQAAGAAARGIVEALAGMRPVAHLAQSCDLLTYEKLRRRVRWECARSTTGTPVPSARRTSGPTAGTPQLRLFSTHSQLVANGVEGSATFSLGGRVRALGFRLEAHRGRWRVVALELG